MALSPEGAPCRPRGGDRPPCRACGRGPPVASPLSPVGGATGPPFIFFSAMDLVANLKKKITSRACRPHRATGGIFEIFQNGHIFLKFCFFKYKKEKPPETSCLHLHRTSNSRPSGPHLPTNNYTLPQSKSHLIKNQKEEKKKKRKKRGETPPPTRSLSLPPAPLQSPPPHRRLRPQNPRAGSRLPAGPAAPCPSAPDSCLSPTLPLPPRSAPSRPPPHPPPRPPLPRRRS